MAYVDGFVVPVPKANLGRYREWAELAAKVWKECGALDYKEWVADDVKPGKVTSFPQAVNLKDDEVVVFAWATYESRQARDATMEKVMKDPRAAVNAVVTEMFKQFPGNAGGAAPAAGASG